MASYELASTEMSLEAEKPYIKRMDGEPLVAYEVFMLYLENGDDKAKIQWVPIQEYIHQKRGLLVPLEELKTWPAKFDWSLRFEEANKKLTKEVNKSFKYRKEVQELDRWNQISDARARTDKLIRQVNKRLPNDIPKLEPAEAVKAYVDLSKLQLMLGRDQREESGKVTPTVTITLDALVERAGEIAGKSPEFLEKVKALALKENFVDADFTISPMPEDEEL